MTIPNQHAEQQKKIRLTSAKNRMRGVISGSRDRSYRKGNGGRSSKLRSSLKSCLLAARAELYPSEYADFLSWYTNLLGSMIIPTISEPGSYQYLSGVVVRSPKVSIRKELLWVATYIGFHASTFSTFVRKALQVEQLILAGEFEASLEELEALDSEHGHSFWSSQLRIAIAQAIGGLEAQKNVVRELRQQHRRGILSYVSYFTGVRNEEKASWSHFEEIIVLRLNETRYPDDLRTYLRFKFLLELPEDDSSIADVLRYEQSNHPFDVYSTFVLILQELATNPAFLHLGEEVARAVKLIEGVADFRILRLSVVLGNSNANGSLKNPDQSLLSPLVSKAPFGWKSAWKASARTPCKSPWEILYRGVFIAIQERSRSVSSIKANQLELLCAAILRRERSAATAIEQWRKLVRNFSGLPIFDGLRQVELSLGLVRSPPSVHSFKRLTLNCERDGPELITLCSKNPIDLATDHPEGSFFAAIFLNDHAPKELSNQLSKEAAHLACALHEYISEDYNSSLAVLTEARHENKILLNLVTPLQSACLLQTNRKKEFVLFIADRVSNYSTDFVFLPVVEAVNMFSKQDWRALRGDLNTLIAIHAAWRLSDQDRLAATLRHELNALLRTLNVQKPTDLLNLSARFDRKHFVYFLRHICKPAFMDLIRAFGSSREVLIERRDIASYLLEHDEQRAEEYTVEVVQISSRLKIDEGLEMVDSSRIHVDGDSYRRWASKHVREDYERYTALVNAGLAAQADIEDVLRTLLDELSTRQAFYTPDDQADAILAGMFTTLGTQFLANSDFGLDYYLSKRIRHQSFIGLIRGPLEFSNLITTRESEFGPYRENTYWGDRLALPHTSEHDVQRAFRNFSEQFDKHLITLKDEILQIRSEEKPHGLFHIPISRQSLFVVRTLTQTGIEFDTFLNATYQLFWQAMEPCLEKAKHEIEVTLKRELVELFAALREDLRPIAEESPHYAELSTQINDTSVEVQRMLDRAASWFVKPDAQPKGGIYTLEEGVDIAIASALSMHRAFDPKLEVTINGHVDLQPPDLLLLWETIFVGIDNVKAHSGFKTKATIELSCRYDGQSMLEIAMLSDLAGKGLSKTAAAKLEAITDKIKRGEIGQTSKKEGGSGFVKLASVLKHTPGGKLDFGVTKDKKFKLSVSFRPTKATVAIVRLKNENTDR